MPPKPLRPLRPPPNFTLRPLRDARPLVPRPLRPAVLAPSS